MRTLAVTPHEVWGAWSLDPFVLLALAAVGWTYADGVRRLWAGGRTGRGVSRRQVASFAAGLGSVAVALVSPLDAMSRALLSAHMVQHLVLMLVAAPLLAMGAPTLAVGAALPPRWRAMAHRIGRAGPGAFVSRTAGHPIVAWVLAAVTLLVWHLPPLYQAAFGDHTIHALEHASFLGTSLLFWSTALGAGRARRLAPGADVFYVVTGGLPGAALGAVLSFASIVLYPAYRSTVSGWGLTPLQDQQLAGVIMWVPSGLIYLVAAAALFVRWLRSVERETTRTEARAGSVAAR